jgi:glycosyltransferase involved in cell wall biosynthesis
MESTPESATEPQNSCELSIVMPCLNEAETLEVCIHKALGFLADHGIDGEVVIADNGSTDGSPELAEAAGARVVHVLEKGYGSALMGGIAAARGTYCIMGDADDSYDFTNLMPFVEKLREGYELVMGNRFKGGIAPGAMPPLHKYLGNPVLTGIGRLFFSSASGDFHCGLRGFRKDSVQALDLQTTGMEFASEMVVKATLLGQRVTEVPTTLSPDGRSRPPHLRSWRDGWRHLRFLLLYSPRWLFLYPGFALVLVGALVLAWLLPGPRVIGSFALNVHTMLYAATAILIGFQSVLFAVFTKVYAINVGLLPMEARLERLFRSIKLETGIVVGGILTLLGVLGTLLAVRGWAEVQFGSLDPSRVQRLVIPSMLALALGLQTVLASFFLSVLGLRRRGTRLPE